MLVGEAGVGGAGWGEEFACVDSPVGAGFLVRFGRPIGQGYAFSFGLERRAWVYMHIEEGKTSLETELFAG